MVWGLPTSPRRAVGPTGWIAPCIGSGERAARVGFFEQEAV